jgi:NAD(P)-dependent dehydrogenase (short-subunit alcohol dehydrogenase family)
MSKNKAIVVGASGLIGREVVASLEATHEIVRAGRRSGDVQVDYTSESSVREMFESVGPYDVLVAVAGGDSAFKGYEQLTDADYQYGFERKFLAQVRLVRLGQDTANDGASFTLSSGFLSHYPNPASVATGPLNAAVDAFVRSAAPTLPRGLRLNVVSPAPVVEPGREGRGTVTAAQTAEAYVQAVEGDFTGRVLRAWGGLPLPAEGDS